ncbi:hypothetical protein P153DRAFT_401087 [Dothidotthia symphoricarpi CBS 119687]|uniref:Uncharacterized protein n=1 Tax=Dothidotthia symphoricarpi CBS 119687 TaxID=1392245 RepID=A0A6A5ZXI3_9PLEO|nr:uncharacterized protein P153DRAFT_401087 [Dothidotthia symphoricarpi CBS 119687]KAF2124472.1 hypothetical protein P153DRAFT_401087 [Dothidotthia symphoricarpi CBS 119687]
MKTLEALFEDDHQYLPAPLSAPAPCPPVSGRSELTSGMEVDPATFPEVGRDTSVVPADGSGRTLFNGYNTVPMKLSDDHMVYSNAEKEEGAKKIREKKRRLEQGKA